MAQELTIPQALALAMGHQNAGRLPEAERIYRQILAAAPTNADALHLLGVVHLQTGRLDVAIELVGRAIQLDPGNAQFHCNMGQILAAAGRKNEAIASLQKALALRPDYPEAMNNLGSALQSAGRLNESIDVLRRARALRPNSALLHFNLGNSLKLSGDVDGAIAEFQQAISVLPTFVEAHQNLGNALMTAGRGAEALAAFQKALEIRPDTSDGFLNLGIALRATGQPEQAIAALRKALEQRPGYSEAQIELGNALHQLHRFSEAAAEYRQVLARRPDSADAAYNLATALQAGNQIKQAIEAYRKVIAIEPDQFKAWVNLSSALIAGRQFTEAIAASRRALELRPQSPEAYLNLANAQCAAGCVSEAIQSLRTALRLDPQCAAAHCNLAYSMCYDPHSTVEAIAAEHRRWNEIHALPLGRHIPAHDNDRSPDRPLKIGYISPDFREHSVATFFQPLLANHDARRFEIFCYANVSCPDAVTANLRKLAAHWHDISTKSDEQIADLVREHRIDILVDLAGHTSDGKLLVFARKPAPIQVTYLGYPNPTALDAIDYRMTDAFADPVENDRKLYPEQLVRLPRTFACYQPPRDAPPVGPLPATTNGFVRFASMNVLPKVNDQVLECWANIVKSVANSRLLMVAPGLTDPAVADRFRAKLNHFGVANDRPEFAGHLTLKKYLTLHDTIDILLDTFPVNGHTITCHALWMGVPVVTLAGTSHFGRLGFSVLSNLKLESLITSSPQAYMETAVQLASDLARLSELRAGLRDRMAHSPLLDAAAFARDIEAAYRTMWRRWCAGGKHGET